MSPNLSPAGRVAFCFTISCIVGAFILLARGQEAGGYFIFVCGVVLFILLIILYSLAVGLAAKIQKNAISIAFEAPPQRFYTRQPAKLAIRIRNGTRFRCSVRLRPYVSVSIAHTENATRYLDQLQELEDYFVVCPSWCGQFAIFGFYAEYQTFDGLFEMERFHSCRLTIDALPTNSKAIQRKIASILEESAKHAGWNLSPETYQLRASIPGDSPSQIAWKASAHRAQLISRQTPAFLPPNIYYILDARSPMRIIQNTTNIDKAGEPLNKIKENSSKDDDLAQHTVLSPYPIYDALEEAIAMVWSLMNQNIAQKQSLMCLGVDAGFEDLTHRALLREAPKAFLKLRLPRDVQHRPKNLNSWINSIADHIRLSRNLEFRPHSELFTLTDLEKLPLIPWCFCHLPANTRHATTSAVDVLSAWCAQERIDVPYREFTRKGDPVWEALLPLVKMRHSTHFYVFSASIFPTQQFKQVQGLLAKNHNQLKMFDFSSKTSRVLISKLVRNKNIMKGKNITHHFL